MKKFIGIALIILSLGLGYLGFTKFADSGESIDIVGIEISAEDNKAKTTSYLYLGFALVSMIGGVTLVNSKS